VSALSGAGPAPLSGADLRSGALRTWVLAEAKAGMRNQALALADALGLAFEAPPLTRIWWLDRLPQWLFASRPVLAAHGLTGPWPDVVIGSGRYAGRLSAALKRLRPRLLNVQIQDPRSERQRFDVIVTPAHDRLRGDNVIHTLGALHAMTPARLAADAAVWAPRLAGPGRLLAVLLGGPTRRAHFDATALASLCDELRALSLAGDWRVALCASRRTPAPLRRLLAERLNEHLHLLWLGEGENPYRGLLALADAFLVSADSVNMASEALAFGRPVHRWGQVARGSRIGRFHAALEARGLVRPWRGEPEDWASAALDELAGTATLIAARLGLPPPASAGRASAPAAAAVPAATTGR